MAKDGAPGRKLGHPGAGRYHPAAAPPATPEQPRPWRRDRAFVIGGRELHCRLWRRPVLGRISRREAYYRAHKAR